jgi:hypothetical protein
MPAAPGGAATAQPPTAASVPAPSTGGGRAMLAMESPLPISGAGSNRQALSTVPGGGLLQPVSSAKAPAAKTISEAAGVLMSAKLRYIFLPASASEATPMTTPTAPGGATTPTGITASPQPAGGMAPATSPATMPH